MIYSIKTPLIWLNSRRLVDHLSQIIIGRPPCTRRCHLLLIRDSIGFGRISFDLVGVRNRLSFGSRRYRSHSRLVLAYGVLIGIYVGILVLLGNRCFWEGVVVFGLVNVVFGDLGMVLRGVDGV